MGGSSGIFHSLYMSFNAYFQMTDTVVFFYIQNTRLTKIVWWPVTARISYSFQPSLARPTYSPGGAWVHPDIRYIWSFFFAFSIWISLTDYENVYLPIASVEYQSPRQHRRQKCAAMYVNCVPVLPACMKSLCTPAKSRCRQISCHMPLCDSNEGINTYYVIYLYYCVGAVLNCEIF